jgi:hypothetical protein
LGEKAEDRLCEIVETPAGIAEQSHQLDARGAGMHAEKICGRLKIEVHQLGANHLRRIP